MRGQVELYNNYGAHDEELVYKDANVIVEGAGELVAHMMTYPTPSLSGSPVLSSILDASNYTVQAISFGKASPNFDKHAHHYPLNLTNSSNVVAFQIHASGSPKLTVLPYSASAQVHSGAISYPGGPYLPSYPSPYDQVLESSCIPPAAYDLSGFFPKLTNDIGQNLNMIPYRNSLDLSSLFYNDIPNAAASSAYFLSAGAEGGSSIVSSLGGSAVWFGCYPEGSSVGSTSAYLVSSWDSFQDNGTVDATAIITTIELSSVFNCASSMDIWGYVGQHYCVSGNIAPTEPATDPYLSGLVISALSDSDGSSVAYSTIIGSGDLGSANLYGGITTMGLWSLDVCKSIEDAKQMPPFFPWNPVNNLRKYKLFSKKVFNENICAIRPDVSERAGHKDLTLIWRLYF